MSHHSEDLADEGEGTDPCDLDAQRIRAELSPVAVWSAEAVDRSLGLGPPS